VNAELNGDARDEADAQRVQPLTRASAVLRLASRRRGWLPLPTRSTRGAKKSAL
jgi:hypothetical protein